MKKDFIEVTPDSGSGDGSLNVKAGINSVGLRTTSMTISGGACLSKFQ